MFVFLWRKLVKDNRNLFHSSGFLSQKFRFVQFGVWLLALAFTSLYGPRFFNTYVRGRITPKDDFPKNIFVFLYRLNRLRNNAISSGVVSTNSVEKEVDGLVAGCHNKTQ